MGFVNWFLSKYKSIFDDKFDACEEAYNAGAQSRQAEIDELQKRIDGALSYVSESPLKDVSRKAMLNFLDILKGGINE